MAVEAPINAADDWFVGEDKVLRFTVVVPAGTTDFLDWEVSYRLFDRRTGDALLEKSTEDDNITLSEGAGVHLVIVQIDAANTVAIPPGTYQHSLWRTDSAAVLAFGPAVLRSERDA